MRAVVMKFGGSSVVDAPAIERVVSIVGRERSRGPVPVVVVSALGGVTDRLLALAELARLGDAPERSGGRRGRPSAPSRRRGGPARGGSGRHPAAACHRRPLRRAAVGPEHDPGPPRSGSRAPRRDRRRRRAPQQPAGRRRHGRARHGGRPGWTRARSSSPTTAICARCRSWKKRPRPPSPRLRRTCRPA